MSTKIKRSVYADMFGPTTGDKVRLADTDLIIEVEKDFTTYGEEVKFGGGKVIRDGMGQSQRMSKDCADTVITNALIIDGAAIEPAFARAARNIPNIDVLPVQGINVYDILRRKNLVLTKSAVDALEARFK